MGNSVHNSSALRAVPPHSERYFVSSLVSRLGKRRLIGRPPDLEGVRLILPGAVGGRDHTYPAVKEFLQINQSFNNESPEFHSGGEVEIRKG
jgi:hypothetical protein